MEGDWKASAGREWDPREINITKIKFAREITNGTEGMRVVLSTVHLLTVRDLRRLGRSLSALVAMKGGGGS